MANVADLLLVLAIGMSLGAVFFGGLLLTVRRLTASPNPARLLYQSMALRLGIALTGFYLVMNGQGGRLAVAVLGFLIVRELIAQRFFSFANFFGGIPWKS